MITDKENTIEAKTAFDVAELHSFSRHTSQFSVFLQISLSEVHPISVISWFWSTKKKLLQFKLFLFS